MAHRLIQAGQPVNLNGERVPLMPLAGAVAADIAADTPVQLAANTFSIHLIPDATAVRIGIYATEALATAGTPAIDCLADVRNEFAVRGGLWIKIA